MSTKNESIVSEVVAASLGGAISASLLYPLEVLKTNLQAKDSAANDDDDEESAGMIATAQQMYDKEGITVFFRGVQFSALQSSLEKALYFFSYTFLKQVHGAVSGGSSRSTLTNLMLGYAAEWSHLPITLPVDAVTTAIQTSSKGDGAFKILLAMLSDKNRNFYKALPAYYLLCLKPALQYTVYEQVKSAWLKTKSRRALTAVEAFALGMVARTVATVLVFPFLRAKVLLQTQTTNASEETTSIPKNTTSILKEQWKHAGLSGLYQGLGPELFRGVFSAALMLMIKERIAEIVQSAVSSR